MRNLNVYRKCVVVVLVRNYGIRDITINPAVFAALFPVAVFIVIVVIAAAVEYKKWKMQAKWWE